MNISGAQRNKTERAEPSAWKRRTPLEATLRYSAILASITLFFYGVRFLNLDLARLFAMFGRVSNLIITRYMPPDMAYVSRGDYLRSVGESVQMAYLGTLLGVLISAPLAWFAAHNMSPARRVLYPIARFIIIMSRAVPEMTWTILFVILLGFGMLPGVLSLIMITVGFTAKLFAEEIEAIDMGPIEAVRSCGANAVQVMLYAVWPQVRSAWAGISIYSWDSAFRAATFVGFFGAGGMGAFLKKNCMQLNTQRVAAILTTIIVLVVISELVSAWVRHRITTQTFHGKKLAHVDL